MTVPPQEPPKSLPQKYKAQPPVDPDKLISPVILWRRRLSEAEKAFLEYEFLPMVRLIECANPDKPRIGTSRRLNDDPLRFSHEPHLQFEATTITAFKQGMGESPCHLTTRFLGLFGPNGPMPLHLTEYAFKREHQFRDTTLRAFADVFHHRILSLFYRAAIAGEPTYSYDRPSEDHFSLYTGALAGFGPTEFRQRDDLPDAVKYHFTAHFAQQTRSADGLLEILKCFFALPIEIEEFIGEWLYISADQVSELGGNHLFAKIGISAALGNRVWSCDTKFRLVFGPLDLADYESLLPDGMSMPRLLSAVRSYVGDELEWDVALVLKREQVPHLNLGLYGKLGWTTWIAPQEKGGPVRDLNLRPRQITEKKTVSKQAA